MQLFGYKILKLLSAEPDRSQRAIAGKMGISLGKTDYVISELSQKGIIEMKRFKNASSKACYAHILTPRGLEQKAKITVRFLKYKLAEYETIKTQIKEISAAWKTARKSGKSLNRVILDMLFENTSYRKSRKISLANSLRTLAGGWSEKDASEFLESIKSSEQIDEEMWK